MANRQTGKRVKAQAVTTRKAHTRQVKAPATKVAAEPVAAPVAKAVTAPEAKPVVKAVAAPVAKPAAVAAVKPVTAPAAKPVAVAPVKPEPAPAPVATIVVEPVVPVTETAPAVTTPAAAATAQPASKETTVMATQFETPQVFADINERAQAAVQKSTKLVEEFNDFAKGNVEAIVESGRITAKGFESLGQDAAEYGRKSFEGFTATLKNLATVKSPADFFKLQSDYVRTSFDSAVAEASKGTEAFIKLASDAAQPLSNRFAVAADKVKAVA